MTKLLLPWSILMLLPACGSDSSRTPPADKPDAATDGLDGTKPDAGDSGGSCTTGTKGGACYANATCNAGLECNSGRCVAGSGSDGEPSDGANPCGDTSSDPNNCGECGRVCESGKCEQGACTNAWSACFEESAGFETCEQACASEGETCAAKGCDGNTIAGWALGDHAKCEANYGPKAVAGYECNYMFTWTDSNRIRRCCCTDTH